MSRFQALDTSVSLQFPLGKFNSSLPGGPEAIPAIADLPTALRTAVTGLSDSQLDTPYREGGWTVRQLVHHVADSHTNASVRFRLALTEDFPTIKPYAEARWAELADARTLPVEASLALLDSLHARWVVLLESLSDAQWARGYVHPEMGRQTLDRAAALYAWHGRHHTAHVTGLLARMNWLGQRVEKREPRVAAGDNETLVLGI
jgi:uncharacterized damage-inducible protein DinB